MNNFCKLVLAISIALDPCYEIVILLQMFPLERDFWKDFSSKDFSKLVELMRLYKKWDNFTVA